MLKKHAQKTTKYIGQTLRRIKDRITEHLRDIDQANKDKPLGLHLLFHETGEERYRRTHPRIHKESLKKSTGFNY